MSDPDNDVLRFRFQQFQQHAAGKNNKTIDELLSALTEFEKFTSNKSFVRLDTDDIVAFKDHLRSRASKTSSKRLAATTITHKLAHLKTFFRWLMDQNEGRAIKSSVVDCFNPDMRTRTAARSTKQRNWCELKDWNRVFAAMPVSSLVQRRDRALIAMLIVTAIRDAALVSLCLKHFDFDEQRLMQDGLEVDTKFGATTETAFFPTGDAPREALRDWHDELTKLGAGQDDPLFPMDVSNAAFFRRQKGLALEHWRTTGPVRRIIRAAFSAANVPYVVPHTIRNTMTQEGLDRNLTWKQQKAWSQNLGHRSISTTEGHYGKLSHAEVRSVMSTLAQRDRHGVRDRLIAAIDEMSPDKQKSLLTFVKDFAR